MMKRLLYIVFGIIATVPVMTYAYVDLVSVNQIGDAVGNASSEGHLVSEDGRYVAFNSAASDLVADDNNGIQDVFVRDMQNNTTVRVSVDFDGKDSEGESTVFSISSDGRYVLFASNAQNLTRNDGNGYQDIFVRDMQANTTILVSANSYQEVGNDISYSPIMTPDGRYVAFSSAANNLVENDKNGYQDIFLKDMHTNTLVRVNVNTSGTEANNNATATAITPDGRYIVFHSEAYNLVDGQDNNNSDDVFVRDVISGSTTLVSVGIDGYSANSQSSPVGISDNGRYILFNSFADNIVENDKNGQQDVFVRDVQANSTNRVNRNDQDKETDTMSYAFSISADGKYVIFYSDSDNLVENDTNGVQDVFVKDLQTGLIKRVSVDSEGNEANDSSYPLSVSSDGRYILLYSDATNLIQDDTNRSIDIFIKDMKSGRISRVNVNENGTQVENEPKITDMGMSKNGKFIVISGMTPDMYSNDTNKATDVFLFDNILFESDGSQVIPHSIIISVNQRNDAPGNGASDLPITTPDGRYVVFDSTADDLVTDDTNGQNDVFMRDTHSDITTRININNKGQETDGDSRVTAITPDGRYVLFSSDATNLVSNDWNGYPDIFVRDTVNNTTTLINTSTSDNVSNNSMSYPIAITPDGRYILFDSNAEDLVPDDTNGVQDIFVRDTLNNTTIRIDVSSKGNQTNVSSQSVQISDDGRYVLFNSDDEGLVENDTNKATDVFLRDIIDGTTVIVSADSDNKGGNGYSNAIKMSTDHRYILFSSIAEDLVEDNSNETIDLFMKDMESGIVKKVNVGNDGSQANDIARYGGMSSDGRYVFFDSRATNLVENDRNENKDIFMRDMLHETTVRVSTDADGNERNAYSETADVSTDGRYLTFLSESSDKKNSDTDILVKDTQSGKIWTASVDNEGNKVAGRLKTGAIKISANGKFVFFSTDLDKFTENDRNDSRDVFMYEVIDDEGQNPIKGLDLISINQTNDAPGNQYSLGTSITPNGRYVLFESEASDLVPEDTNDVADVFVRDRQKHKTIRVSVNDADEQGNSPSHAIDITPDGRYVLFYSEADNIVSEDRDGITNLFVRDLVNRTTVKVTTREIDRKSRLIYGSAMISDDGRYVYFDASSPHVEDDTNGAMDVYRTDIIKDEVVRMSADTSGNEMVTGSILRNISTDNNYVMYQEIAGTLINEFRVGDKFRSTSFGNIYLRHDDQIQIVNVDDTNIIPDVFGDIFMSNDGRYVGFQTATEIQLRERDQRNYLYVRDTIDGTTKYLTKNVGEKGNMPIEGRMLAMSADGRYVVFTSDMIIDGNENKQWGMFRIDLHTNIIIPVASTIDIDNSMTEQVAMRGRKEAPQAYPHQSIIGDYYDTYISADGNIVVFSSMLSNYIENDTNGAMDIFVKDIGNDSLERVSLNKNGEEANDESTLLGISADGTNILFDGYADNMIDNDINEDSDVFVATYTSVPPSTANIEYPANQSYVTEKENIVIVGSGYPNADIELRHEKDVYQTSVDSRGHWSIEIPGEVFEGTHALSVRQKIPNANSYAALIRSEFYVDRTQPDAPIINDPVENDLVQGSGEPGAMLTLHILGYTEFTGTVDQDGHWEFDISGLPIGAYKAEAKQIDMASLESEWSNTVKFSRGETIVIGIPVITEPTSGQVLLGKDVDIAGLGTAGYNIHLELDGIAYNAIVDNQGQRTIRLQSLMVGNHIAHVWQDNGLGINSESNAVSFTIAAPTVNMPTIIVPISGTLFKSNDITIYGTGTQGYILHLQLSGTTYTGQIDNNGHWTMPIYKLGNGSYTVIAWQTDELGNRGIGTQVSFIMATLGGTGIGYGGGKGPGGSTAGSTNTPVVSPKDNNAPIKEIDTTKPITPVVIIPENHPNVVVVNPTTPNIAIKEAIVQTSYVSIGSTVGVKTVENLLLQTEKKCYTPKEVVDITLGKDTANKDLLVYQALLKSYDLTIFTDTDKYLPENGLKRHEAAKMFTNFAKHVLCRESVQKYADISVPYTDIDDVDPTLKPYIIEAYEYGILKGSNNKFRPLDRITRKEFVAALMRMFINANLDIQDAGNDWDTHYQAAFKEYGLESIVGADEEINRYDMSKIMYKLYYNTTYQWTDKGYVLPYSK